MASQESVHSPQEAQFLNVFDSKNKNKQWIVFVIFQNTNLILKKFFHQNKCDLKTMEFYFLPPYPWNFPMLQWDNLFKTMEFYFLPPCLWNFPMPQWDNLRYQHRYLQYVENPKDLS